MYSDSRFLSIHGLSVHYRVISPAGAARHRVLLVPSPGQSSFNWRAVVPELTQAGCQCVLIDLPGYGLSQCRDDAPQDHATRARFLWGVLDALDLKKGNRLNTWHLMAHGSACGTLAAMAAQAPDSVASVTLFAPVLRSPLPSFLTPLIRRRWFNRVIRLWFRRNIMSYRRFAHLMERIYAAPLPDDVIMRLQRPLLRLSGHEEMLRHLLLEGYETDWKQLNALFSPAMVFWGSRDHLLGSQVPDRLRKQDFSRAEYHVLPCGHCPGETQSGPVRDFLRGWIRDLWG